MSLTIGRPPIHRAIDQVVDLFAGHVRVRCWPWERARFYVEEFDMRTETASDDVWIRGTLTSDYGVKRHARLPLSGKVLRAYDRTGQQGFLVDAVRHVVEELAEKLATRPAYTPPPKGWKKFGRIRR